MRSQLRTPPAGFASADHADDLTGYSPYRSFPPRPMMAEGRRNSGSWQILAHETPMWFGIHGGKMFANKLPRPDNVAGLIVAPTPSPEQLSIADRTMAMTSEDYRTPDLVARLRNCRSRAGIRTPGGGLRTPGRGMNSRAQTPCTTARGIQGLAPISRSATPSQGQYGWVTTADSGQVLGHTQMTKCKDNPRLASFKPPRFPHLVRFAPTGHS